MSSDTAVRLPSQVLPQGVLAFPSRVWDWITELGARPARYIGLDRKVDGLATATPYLLFVTLLSPALLSLEWWQPLEAGRAQILDQMPPALRRAVLDPIVSLTYLSTAYVLIVSLNRAWSMNEKTRETHAALLDYGENDKLADMRAVGILSALLLIVVLPLWLRALNQVACESSRGCLYSGADTLSAWFWYCVVAIMPNSYYAPTTSITELAPWSSVPKYILWPSLNAVLVFMIFEIARIEKVTELAVDSLRHSHERAVAVGSRILGRLVRIIEYDDKERLGFDFYKNAAVAMGRISSPRAIPALMRLAGHHANAYVRNRAVQALGVMRVDLGAQSAHGLQIERFLRQRLEEEKNVSPLGSIKSILGMG